MNEWMNNVDMWADVVDLHIFPPWIVFWFARYFPFPIALARRGRDRYVYIKLSHK